ncbi:TIGR01212 family radical SAM protein [Thermodesulfobacteriota bacterium]
MKRCREYNSYLREIFGQRVQKISLDAGLKCPNRDGTISDKGCIFCDSRGSGTGALINQGLSLDEQITRAKAFIRKRYAAKKFIAYFQSFTNTYATIEKLKSLYDSALSHEDMVGLSIGTRPDCIDGDTLRLLSSYKDDFLVWIEYGLQSAHDKTLEKINRGHSVSCFEDAVRKTHEYGINICAHVILGLPGEDRDKMLQTARFLSELPIQGVKIHLMYVIKGTPLSQMYKNGEFKCLEQEEFTGLVVDFLELLPPETVIQRITGDPPVKSELVAPMWALNKSENLKHIRDTLERRDTWQGRLFKKYTAGNKW